MKEMKKTILRVLICIRLLLGCIGFNKEVKAEEISEERTFENEKPELIVLSGINNVKLTWNKIKGATGYEVYRSKDKLGEFKRIKRVEGTRKYTLYYNTDQPYYYKLRGYKVVNGKKVYTKYSKIVKGKADVKAVKVRKITKISENKVCISWDRLNGYDGYMIFVKKNEKYEKLCTVSKKIKGVKVVKSDGKLYKIKAYKNINGKLYYSKMSDSVRVVSRHKINVKYISQLPNLPTGCEITSLTTVLNYLGFDVTKETMADEYLEKGAIGTVDFREAFVGNPYDDHSYGCYAPVIVKTANKYLSENKSDLRAYDMSGKNLTELYKYVCEGKPVVIWNTTKMNQEPFYTTTWNINGKNIRWLCGEHCMVLIGFDLDRNVVIVSDPMVGKVEYDRELFEKRYIQFFKQAVVIE